MPYINLDPTTAAPISPVTLGSPLISTGTTLADFIAELKALLGGRTDLPDTRYRDWINAAYSDIITAIDLPQFQGTFGFTSVANQPMYQAPSNIAYTISGSVLDDTLFAGGRPLDKIDLDAYREMPEFVGEITAYLATFGIILLYPTPDDAWEVAIDAMFDPLPLTQSNHSPAVPFMWHEGILLGAQFRAFRSLMEYDKANIVKNDYLGFMRARLNRKAQEKDGMIGTAYVVRNESEVFSTRDSVFDKEPGE